MEGDPAPEPQPSGDLSARSSPGFLSSASALALPVGSQVETNELAGYYIDFRRKAVAPSWPPPWFPAAGMEPFVAIAQWGLGCYERYLAGEGEVWRDAALEASDYLLGEQVREGAQAGGWVHAWALRHTYQLERGWMSAMAQGEGASLLLRALVTTGDDRYAEGAARALLPLGKVTSEGGLRVPLNGGYFLEEYPTDPPSLVLNGGIFALWGYHDAAVALGDSELKREFAVGVESLGANIDRWDTGTWSRYDRYPHPVVNVASSFYHALHIEQLRAMQLIAPTPDLEAAAKRFERYRASRAKRTAAFARKAVFRLLVPRNRRRVAWVRRGR